MKRFFGAGLIVLMMAGALFMGCSPKKEASDTGTAKPKFISIGTSSSGGAFSIIGTAMGDVINKNIPGVTANIEITGGSAENLILASTKKIELAMSASDVLYLATTGTGSFEGKKITNVKGVMGGHMTILQVYVLKDGPIKKYEDLKGKKIAVGPSGSVGNDAMKFIMEAYGYKINKDWTPEYLSHGDGAEALVDRNVDAVCIMSTVPCGPASTAAASKPITLLDMSDEKTNQITKAHPYYVKASIPAGVYTGQDKEIKNTFGSPALLVANEDMPAEDIYNVMKVLYEHNDALVKAYPQCIEWNIGNATRGLEGIVEMHPGSVKYLKEKGVMK